jgi:phosphoribosylformylglycinamidine cyclo-ligase
MLETFNMGVGFVVLVPPDAVQISLDWFSGRDLAAYEIGEVIVGDRNLVFY